MKFPFELRVYYKKSDDSGWTFVGSSDHKTEALALKRFERLKSMGSPQVKATARYTLTDKRTHARNPRNVDAVRARALYRAFRDQDVTRVRRINLPSMPRAVMVVGYLSAVEYDTTQEGRSKAYRHVFARASRPLLCSDGRRLFILKGRYRVTGRGIVDLNSNGREIE